MVEQLADKAIVAKMDVDANAQIPAKFGIRRIPTPMIFKGGQVVGAVPKSVLEQKLNDQLAVVS